MSQFLVQRAHTDPILMVRMLIAVDHALLVHIVQTLAHLAQHHASQVTSVLRVQLRLKLAPEEHTTVALVYMTLGVARLAMLAIIVHRWDKPP